MKIYLVFFWVPKRFDFDLWVFYSRHDTVIHWISHLNDINCLSIQLLVLYLNFIHESTWLHRCLTSEGIFYIFINLRNIEARIAASTFFVFIFFKFWWTTVLWMLWQLRTWPRFALFHLHFTLTHFNPRWTSRYEFYIHPWSFSIWWMYRFLIFNDDLVIFIHFRRSSASHFLRGLFSALTIFFSS